MKHRALLAVGLTLSLTAVACGDDKPTTAPTTKATTGTTTTGSTTTGSTTGSTKATTGSTTGSTTTGSTTGSTAGSTTGSTTGATTGSTTASSAPGTTMAPVTPGPDWPKKLVFTLTPSQEAGGLIETAKPLADMLSKRLNTPVEALLPSDYAGVIVALESGQAQVAGGLGPNQMVQAEAQAKATLILQASRRGALTYVTQWFTNDPKTFCKDEPKPAGQNNFLFCNGVGEAKTAEDGPLGEDMLAKVAGKTIAFVDQGSTSGYLVPALQLMNAGVDPAKGITPKFAGGHDKSVQAVYDGDAQVGVSFNDARGQLLKQLPDVGTKVVVFGWSGPIPNDGFAVAGNLPEDLKKAITAAFVDIANTEEGAKVLEELYEIDGLAPVDSKAYDVIRELNKKLADLMK